MKTLSAPEEKSVLEFTGKMTDTMVSVKYEMLEEKIHQFGREQCRLNCLIFGRKCHDKTFSEIRSRWNSTYDYCRRAIISEHPVLQGLIRKRCLAGCMSYEELLDKICNALWETLMESHPYVLSYFRSICKK